MSCVNAALSRTVKGVIDLCWGLSLHTIDFAELSRLSDELDAEKPYIELIDGLELRKMSPKLRHGELQYEFMKLLDAWSAGRGKFGLEWRCWLVAAGPRRTSLVPDVAWVSEERFAPLDAEAKQTLPFAPDIAIEIRSPGDRLRNLQRKVELYLAHGSRLVLDVDPKSRTIVAHDRTSMRTFKENERFEHAEAPGLNFDLKTLFGAVT